MNKIIRTTHLTKYFKTTHAVEDVSLSIDKGEIFGFLGLNGAGKTTVIRMLLGMIVPTKGECYLKGKKVHPEQTSLWNKVGYMVETPYSYPELTVRENLDVICKLRSIKDKKAVGSIMKRLNLEAYAGKKAGHLSLGNSQRLGIAKALIHKPEILILDEPMSGLDPAGIVETREMLQNLARNEGVTIFISSHQLDEISKITTKIGIIHKGKLIKEINTVFLEKQLKKSLIIDGKNRAGIMGVLANEGFENISQDSFIRVANEDVLNNPEKVVIKLVNEGYPPSLFKIEKEDLEAFFLRTIKEAGGSLE